MEAWMASLRNAVFFFIAISEEMSPMFLLTTTHCWIEVINDFRQFQNAIITDSTFVTSITIKWREVNVLLS